MKKLFTILLLLINSSNILAQNEDTYQKSLKKFLETQGTFEVFQTQINTLFTMFNVNNLLDEDEINKIKDEAENEILKIYVPIYKNHFTESEINEAIGLYEKEKILQKIAKKTPIMSQEAVGPSMQWGAQLGQKLQTLIAEKNKND